MRSSKIVRSLSEYLQIALGILVASIGLKAFLLPNGFLDGGVTGIAILISRQTGIDISLLLLVISIPFLVLGAYTVSHRILIKSIFSIVLLAISINIESFGVITEDKLLIAIFGGLFLGAGIGLAIRNGSVLDGSEILGIFVYDRFGIGIGKTILFFNVVLFLITAVTISTEIAMYSTLTYLITAKVIDLLIEGFEDFIGIMIVSKKTKLLEQEIINKLGAGMTIYKGESGYGSTGKTKETRIIHTAINRIDIRKIHRIINLIDRDAFVLEFDVNSVKGGVLRRYLSKKKQKKLPPSLYRSNQ